MGLTMKERRKYGLIILLTTPLWGPIYLFHFRSELWHDFRTGKMQLRRRQKECLSDCCCGLAVVLAVPLNAAFYPLGILVRETRLLVRSFRGYWASIQHIVLPWTSYVRKRRARQNETRSPFLRLPGELRNQIYEFAMPTNLVIERSGCMEYRLSRDSSQQDGLRISETEDYLRAIGPGKWNGIANMTQVCHALRLETLAHFHGRNSFAFARQPWSRGSDAKKHSRKWNYDLNRTSLMRVEHWLKTRPSEALPFLNILLMSSATCPETHHDHIRRAHTFEQDPDDHFFGSWQTRSRLCMSGSYLIMLDFADSRNLQLVRAARSRDAYMTLHDCRECLERVESRWRELTTSDAWRSARDNWHDQREAGTLSWKDALRMVDLIRDFK